MLCRPGVALSESVAFQSRRGGTTLRRNCRPFIFPAMSSAGSPQRLAQYGGARPILRTQPATAWRRGDVSTLRWSLSSGHQIRGPPRRFGFRHS
jgi:hypothetical protein